MTMLMKAGVIVLGLAWSCASPTLDTRNTSTTTVEYEAPVVDPVRSDCTNTAVGASITVESFDGGQRAVRVRPGPVELNGIRCTDGRSLSVGSGRD
jgi:hypothetical protein